MANQRVVQLLSLSFISSCLCFSVGIGLFIPFGKVPVLEANKTVTEPELYLFSESEPTPPLNTVRIKAVGDIIPGTNFPDYRLPQFQDTLLPMSVRGYLQGSDILLGNLETTFTNYPHTSKDITGGQIFAFRSPPSYTKLFADVGFNVFHIANNHAMDFGSVGFQDTVKNLKKVGIATLGHKNQILYLEANNIAIAMIGFAPYNMYNSIQNIKVAQALVAKAKKNADVVVVSMHAGAEGTAALHVRNTTEFFYGENRGNSIQFARTVIDAGADLVIGHGPHVPRAIEMYKGKLIAYSLGNFLGYRTLSTKAQTAYSMILGVILDSQGKLVGGQIIPIYLNKQGIPEIDQYFRTVGLLRYLNKNHLLVEGIEINRKGEIVLLKNNP
ncbi:CapA family protein [Umezakia ovalisporum]|jgi:poly-gamma-glutamate capsule biosynthesis protein CapA/YwtB (metallophosphatase superfamily)|uniref:CapA family protein n=2 Tax=Umezakia ovalisporum TaxID=75695 RepID=A0AA43H053_9CYAN|nr:CapA family protein [Umezakia ovalisporum]MBI1243203.1 CapA family protein [Nostoc sp. RI_552]MDH6055640.1 CapA family protein [Umezakia ovalisporum FSS-43]MDH6064643.1 CapA family protein [Umezakia ovalisporum FSS-62]MDH6067661.1 CapA family protein [Umezakia ovalisporum APH033B]MDH6069643.1 CapA family protein [Umezakia ovalisporum CobakiLakeA]